MERQSCNQNVRLTIPYNTVLVRTIFTNFSMSYEHLNGTHSSPKITGHAKMLGHPVLIRYMGCIISKANTLFLFQGYKARFHGAITSIKMKAPVYGGTTSYFIHISGVGTLFTFPISGTCIQTRIQALYNFPVMMYCEYFFP